jgi:hypothetical protein
MGRDNMECLGSDERIMLQLILKIGREFADCVQLVMTAANYGLQCTR